MNTAVGNAPATSADRSTRAPVAGLFRDSYALGVSTVASAALGFGAWVVAAHYHSRREIGYASGLLQAVMLVSALGLVNLSPGLIRFLPVAGRQRRRLIGATYAVSGTVTAVVAIVFAAAGPAHLFDGASVAAFFGFGVAVLWSLFTLQDAALTGLGGAPWVAGENTVFGVLRIGGIIALGASGGRWAVVGSWFLPAVLLIVVVNLGPLRWLSRSTVPPSAGVNARIIGHYVGVTWFPTMLQHCFQLVTPLVVLASIGATKGSAFSMAWLLMSNIELVAIGFGNALVVHGAKHRSELGSLMRAGLRRQAQILIPMLLGIALLATPILTVFGSSYAADGSLTLRLLAISLVPRLFTLALSSGARVAGRLRAVSFIQVPITGLIIGLSIVLVPTYGMVAVGWSALTVQTGVALASIPLWRELTGTPE